MAWLPPELEMGEEPELKPLDPELELELELPEPEPEPEELLEPEPVELEPEEVEPVEAEPPVEPVEPVELVVRVEPGRTKARAPAVTTLAMVTTVVVDRTLL